MSNTCETCSENLLRKMYSRDIETLKQFSRRRFCDTKCRDRYISKAHSGKVFHNQSPFVKGHMLWDNPKSIQTRFTVGQEASPHSRPSGEDHYNWKGGITSENEKVRKSKRYKDWRKHIMERDNYTCQNCGQHGGNLSVDHIKPFSLFIELRFEDSNARTLCWDCHTKTETYAGRVRNYA